MPAANRVTATWLNLQRPFLCYRLGGTCELETRAHHLEECEAIRLGRRHQPGAQPWRATAVAVTVSQTRQSLQSPVTTSRTGAAGSISDGERRIIKLDGLWWVGDLGLLWEAVAAAAPAPACAPACAPVACRRRPSFSADVLNLNQSEIERILGQAPPPPPCLMAGCPVCHVDPNASLPVLERSRIRPEQELSLGEGGSADAGDPHKVVRRES